MKELIIGVAFLLLGGFTGWALKGHFTEACADTTGWEARYARSVEIQDTLRAYIARDLEWIDTVKASLVPDTVKQMVYVKSNSFPPAAAGDISTQREVLTADPK